jgi:hypothetical protein
MSRRIFNTVIDDYIQNYQTTTRSPYDDNRFRTPASVPAELLEIVQSIKRLTLKQREYEIIQELQKGRRAGDAVIVPKEKAHLLDELDSIKGEVQKWTTPLAE